MPVLLLRSFRACGIAVAVTALTTGPVACGPSHEQAEHASARTIPAESFTAAFSVVGRIRLEQPESAIVVRVSGVAVLNDGRIAVGDASEGKVKLYSRAGELLRVIGRKGSGPGEFQTPRRVQQDERGRLHVFDTQLSRVTVLAPDSALVRTVTPDSVGYATDFTRMADGSYVFATPGREADGPITLHDSLGVLRSRLLRGFRIDVPQPDNPAWRTIEGMYASAIGDTVYVTCTFCAQLASVDVRRGTSRTESLDFEGRIAPAPPGPDVRSVADIPAWTGSFHMTALVRTSATGLLFTNMVRGILNYGDPNVLLLRDARGRWRAFADAPPVLAVSGDTLLALVPDREGRSGEVVFEQFVER